MAEEIGSIFEIDRQKLGADNAVNGCGPFEQNGRMFSQIEDWCYTTSGREAIDLALSDIETGLSLQNVSTLTDRQKKCCLLPMYTCDTVILPFVRRGWELKFYPVGRDLRISRQHFARAIEEVQPQVVLIHSYYGTDTLSEIREGIKAWQQRGILFMEDLTQSLWLLQQKEITCDCDYYIASLRKWLGIPDGGVLASKRDIRQKPQRESAAFVKKKLEALTEKQEYLNLLPSAAEEDSQTMQRRKKAFLDKNRGAEEMLDGYGEVCKMSSVSRYLWNRADFSGLSAARADNARELYEGLSALADRQERIYGSKGFELPLSYSGSEAPLYVPVLVNTDLREPLQRYLSEHQIYAPVLWPVAKELAGILTEDVRFLYDSMLALPCDQRYGRKDMKRIIKGIEAFMTENVTEEKR